MAKLSRNLLKDLVKECLVEILAEGLANPGTTTEKKVSKPAKSRPKRKHPTDFMEVNTTGITQKPVIKENLRQRIDSAAGGNDVMRDILADTAQRTLPTMVAADSRNTAGDAQRHVHGDAATKAMTQADPMDLFEGSSNWAALAFSDSKASANS